MVFAVAYLLSGFWAMSGLVWVLLQGGCAALIAWRLEATRGWLCLHLVLPFLLLLGLALGIDARWSLAIFVLLLLIFGRTDISRVPLYLSNNKAGLVFLAELQSKPLKIMDIGCGTGGFLRQIAADRPDCTLVGVEHAPLTWLWAKLSCLRYPNIQIRLGSFWKVSLEGVDYVYAFLSPAPMEALWQKASRELPAGAWLVSNSFEVPNRAAEHARAIDQGRQTQLYFYKSPK